jgi:hypothetical protein
MVDRGASGTAGSAESAPESATFPLIKALADRLEIERER